MAGMEGLGRLFNVVYPADNVYVNLALASGVTFVSYEADGATALTITFSDDASGTHTSTPDVIDHFYASSTDQDSGLWHRTDQTAAELVSPANTTEDLAAVYVSAEMCPDGKPYVKCDSDAGTPVVVAILHDLAQQGAPARLANPRA